MTNTDRLNLRLGALLSEAADEIRKLDKAAANTNDQVPPAPRP